MDYIEFSYILDSNDINYKIESPKKTKIWLTIYFRDSDEIMYRFPVTDVPDFSEVIITNSKLVLIPSLLKKIIFNSDIKVLQESQNIDGIGVSLRYQYHSYSSYPYYGVNLKLRNNDVVHLDSISAVQLMDCLSKKKSFIVYQKQIHRMTDESLINELKDRFTVFFLTLFTTKIKNIFEVLTSGKEPQYKRIYFYNDIVFRFIKLNVKTSFMIKFEVIILKSPIEGEVGKKKTLSLEIS